jgi:hypothetical protein
MAVSLYVGHLTVHFFRVLHWTRQKPILLAQCISLPMGLVEPVDAIHTLYVCLSTLLLYQQRKPLTARAGEPK